MTSDERWIEVPAGITRKRLLRNAGVLGGALAVGAAFGGSGLAAVTRAGAAASLASALTLTPEQEEGPFYVALEKIRRDIRLGRKGVPLRLRITVLHATTGKPVPNAACDIWQCDATGVYSDEASERTVGQSWLRGVQLTDASGVALFDTIYPGYYQGRTTHIHVKVRVGGTTKGAAYTGGHVSHTGQLLFDDAISTEVYKLAPYSTETVARTLNAADRIYTQQGGSRSRVKLTRLGSTLADGFLGAITLAVNPSATPAAVGVAGHP